MTKYIMPWIWSMKYSLFHQSDQAGQICSSKPKNMYTTAKWETQMTVAYSKTSHVVAQIMFASAGDRIFD